jgi:hypothetical protein
MTQLDWELRNAISHDDGIRVIPKGALLIFAGSGDWLRLGADLSTDQGFELIDRASGRRIGSLSPDEDA